MANNQQSQRNFFLAVMLSLGVLLLWSYLFPPPKPEENANANANPAAVTQNQQSAVETASQPNAAAQTNTVAPDDVPNRVLTVKTPLYEAKFDSRGALVTSWILLKNKTREIEKPLFSIASTKDDLQPLELIPAEGLKRREVPLRLNTGDANLDALLNDRNYQIVDAEADQIVLNDGESRKISFVLRDEANQVQATKTLTLHADSYISDLQTTITRNNQLVANAKLLIGASIGDQGIRSYNYYSIEPEAVAVAVDGTIERYQGASFAKNNNGRLALSKTVNWAGVGDTYFAMAAIPTQTLTGLELQSTEYEVPLPEPRTNGIWGFVTGDKIYNEKRHLVSAFVPISADGASVTKIYTGSKDHFLLTDLSQQLSQQLGRNVDLEDFINYGWMSWLVRPITLPILWTLNRLSQLTNSYGVAILVFTLLFISLLFPMRWYQSKSFKKAAKNQPKMKELQDRLKELQEKKVPLDDPRMRELQMEQLKLTKDAVPLGGCLPLLLQFPLLIAVYTAITISLDFRQATFLWLPDLSQADPFHALEFAFAGSFVLTMMFTPTAPAMTPEQQMQQKMMTYMMPLMMLWVMWGAPSGLLVYWLASNIIGFGQQLIINRLNKTNDEPPTATTGNQRTMTKKEMKTSLSPSS